MAKTTIREVIYAPLFFYSLIFGGVVENA